jgi:hypothetical protein
VIAAAVYVFTVFLKRNAGIDPPKCRVGADSG